MQRFEHGDPESSRTAKLWPHEDHELDVLLVVKRVEIFVRPRGQYGQRGSFLTRVKIFIQIAFCRIEMKLHLRIFCRRYHPHVVPVFNLPAGDVSPPPSSDAAFSPSSDVSRSRMLIIGPLSSFAV